VGPVAGAWSQPSDLECPQTRDPILDRIILGEARFDLVDGALRELVKVAVDDKERALRREL
jgi:hypothetical protein